MPVHRVHLDVDGLGELNAVHGHQAGDAVLRGTARTIKRATREYDLPARLAGGLFAVLLPETDLAQAQVVAERIRRDSAERRHEVPDSVEPARVTVSIGGGGLGPPGGPGRGRPRSAPAGTARTAARGRGPASTRPGPRSVAGGQCGPRGPPRPARASSSRQPARPWLTPSATAATRSSSSASSPCRCPP